jgi:hypothetical protein
MRRARIIAATAAISLSATALVSAAGASTAVGDKSAGTTAKTSYVVLADKGASVTDLAAKLSASGAKVTSVNKAIGLLTVTSTKAGFATKTAGLAHVAGVAADRSIGYAPTAIARGDVVEKEAALAKTRGKSVKAAQGGAPGGDPLDNQLWGMEMINAVQSTH